METSEDFLGFKAASSNPQKPNLGLSDAISQNIKTVCNWWKKKKPANSVELPACGLVPFTIFFTQILKPRTLDPRQCKEEAARPRDSNVSKESPGDTSAKELNEALEQASAYRRIRSDASSSGQECGEALDSVLKRNLSRRLDSIVLVEDNSSSISRQYQARESVITRTPTRLAATSTPSSSPIPPPIPPKHCQSLAPTIL